VHGGELGLPDSQDYERSIVETETATRMTLDDLRAGPATVSLPASNRLFGFSRGHGYNLAKRGQYPARVIKAGGTYRVVTADLLALLEAVPRGDMA
jgi:hypothetical protein